MKILLNKHGKILQIIIFAICNYHIAISQITITVSHWECGKNGGQITITGLPDNTIYEVGYTKDKTAVPPVNYVSDKGTIMVKNLTAGTYSSIRYKLTTAAAPTLFPGVYVIQACIAKQTTKFLAAGFTNFTGVQDDDPQNYTQIYASLSQPLNRSQGISPDGNDSRLIWARNGYFQIVYGNTDNFKMYSFDTLNDKYVNRLDLLAHSYLNANVRFNIVTYIVPKTNNEDQLAHIYLDLMSSLLETNVTDTFSKNNSSTNKIYNIKSALYGLNLRSKFLDVFDTRFGIEAGIQVFKISPLSSTTNPTLNPQNNNAEDISNAQNLAKKFTSTHSPFYINLDALVSYNTTSVSSNSTSNIFIHYSFTSNYAKRAGKNFSNSYFQLQLGYALDVSKIFANSNSNAKNNSQTAD